MEAAEQAEELDGCYPPGDRFLKIDQEPVLWKRADPCEHMEYVSINELVSQNNLRLAEWYARILASGGDIGDVQLRSVEECVNDARHAFYVAAHVRDCAETAEPHNAPPGISFGERRTAQAIRNRAAYFAANSIIDISEHAHDEQLQIDAIEWLRSIRKPLPPPPPHPGTPMIPGEFSKFPILGPRPSPKNKGPMAPTVENTKTPVKPNLSRHRRNKTSMESPGFYIPPAQLTRSTSEVAGLGMRPPPRLANPEFSFPALPKISESSKNTEPLAGATAVQHTTDSSQRYATWADLAGSIPKSISVPQMNLTPMNSRQRRMLEDYRAKNPKKPYVSLAERERIEEEQKVPTHVLLARSRTDGFSPKKLDTESMPSMFTPKKERSLPPAPRKDSVGQTSNLVHHEGPPQTRPSTPTRESSNAQLSASANNTSENAQLKPTDSQPGQNMGPPKFYTHKRNHGMSKSSPQSRSSHAHNSVGLAQGMTLSSKPSADATFLEKLEDRSSKGSFTYTHEHEKALMAGGFIPPPPPVPEKSPLRTVQPLHRPQYDEHRLRRVESQRNLSPEKKKSTETIGRREGYHIAKSVTTFNLKAAAVGDSIGIPRSETVPGNLQEASANVLDVPDELYLDLVEAVQQITPTRKHYEVGYRDTLQMKNESKAKKLSKLKPIEEGSESPSKARRVVDSMQIFNPSFWNRDGASSPSKNGRAMSPTAAETTKDKKQKKERTFEEKDKKQKKERTFEEKKPFLKAMWENMSRKVHKPKPSASTFAETGIAPSAFMISCEPAFQASLYSRLELLLCTLANRFLMEEYNASRITRTQATSYVSRWVLMGRAQFTEFNCGLPFQAQIVWELKDQLMFFGTYDQRLRDTTVSTWQINAKEMAVKTGCMGDSAMQKHLQDSWKVLELLGGTWDDFEALSKLHVGFHEEVAKAKKRNDALGIPHEWNPKPVPKTPAVGTLIRTPMLK